MYKNVITIYLDSHRYWQLKYTGTHRPTAKVRRKAWTWQKV